ncbi:MAG: phosphoglycerate kinase [Candidatus Marinimicrobia bacterium]|nr:phosphoglycerate kinase [Candidatus Neomarinimicrobiota bacterium]
MIRNLKVFDLKHKHVLMRVDYNVPMKGEQVADNFRINASLPTINYMLEEGAALVLMSHLGRPNGISQPDLSLMPIGEELAGLLEIPIKFSHDCISQNAIDTSLGLKPGEIHLLENLRFHKQEEQNEPKFSRQIARHGSIFINDAFGTSHRSHASNVGVVKHFKHRGIGFLVEKEMIFLDNIIRKPNRPLAVILGGAKIKNKLSLIQTLINKADIIFIGGGMSFTFLRAKGKEIGESLVEKSMLSTAKGIINQARIKGVKIVFPDDFICGQSLDDQNPKGSFNVNLFPKKLMGLDIGPNTVKKFISELNKANTVIWNGPLGLFEIEGYHYGTYKIAKYLSEFNKNGKTVIIGGGDTASAINQFKLTEKMSHVSTGGGASLELLSGKRLPALESLDF